MVGNFECPWQWFLFRINSNGLRHCLGKQWYSWRHPFGVVDAIGIDDRSFSLRQRLR